MKENERKKTPLYVPVLWYMTTILWTITFCTNLSHRSWSDGLVIMQGLTVLSSLAAAVANTVRYIKTKDIE